jgi:hypothetical protein
MDSDIKFDLRDISIVPTVLSDISSRSECKTTYTNGLLPLMTAPMDTVVSNKNFLKFVDNDIIPCMPRGEYYPAYLLPDDPVVFQAYGLSEIEYDLQTLGDNRSIRNTERPQYWRYKYVLIDIANGHMQKLIDILKMMKTHTPDVKVMVGNVGQPLTYKNLAMAGADYVRCSIGTGAGCTTAANVAINYPLGSLISECKTIKKEGDFETKIVADGGMQGYDDIIKALALGADYVMVGSLFNKTMQSSGSNHLWGIKIPFYTAKRLWKWGFPVKKKYRGMSTKAVQRKWGKTKLTTAEGITKYQKVEYNLSQWRENFEDYFRSNMSYCGSKDLQEFIGEVEWVYITNNALKRFAK